MNSTFFRAFLGLCALVGLRQAEANQVVLPGSLQVSTANRDSEPAGAFNTVDRRWLIVWREASATFTGVGSVWGRILGENGVFLGKVFTIDDGGEGLSAPRVAYDPLRNEWMVLYSHGGGPIDPFERAELFARKVSTTGGLVGSARCLPRGPGNSSWYDVAAATQRSAIFPQPTTPYFVAVWEQDVSGAPAIVGISLYDDASQQGRIGYSGTPYRIDTGASLPPTRKSTRPRIGSQGPLVNRTIQFPRIQSYEETSHRVVYEVESAGQKDIFLTTLNLAGPITTVRITGTPGIETEPVAAWNSQSKRTMVLYKGQQGIRARLTGPTSTAPFHELLGSEIQVSPGETPSLAAQSGTDVFFASAHNNGGCGLGCLAGLRVAGTPASGAGSASQPDLSASDAGGVLLLFRRTEQKGVTHIRASLVAPVPPVANAAPVARAGSDLEVVEGTLFSLNGSASSDADGDPLRYLWSRTGGGQPEDYFVDASQRTIAKPQLRAPMLGPSAQPITLGFELLADDFRIQPPFGSSDAVSVKVIAGADPHPPIARAGSDRTVDEAKPVQLDGSTSSDADGDALTFHWTLESVTPPVISPGDVPITNPGAAVASFTSPRFANAGGIDLRFKLEVTTPRGGSGEDVVVIHVRDSLNEEPIADAGADLTGAGAVEEGTPFSLDGTASRDPNGGTLTYHWELLSALSFNGTVRETVDIAGADTASPSVTANVFNERNLEFKLTVKDPGGLEGADTVVARVKTVPMSVLSVTPMEGSPGTRVVILGLNLFEPNTHVYFGGTEITNQGRIVSMSDTRIEVLVPSGGPNLARVLITDPNLPRVIAKDYLSVKSGPVIITKGSEEYRSAQPFVISHAQITEVHLSQGIPSYPLVMGKDTAVHVRVRVAPGPELPLPGVSAGSLTVLPSEGPSFEVPATDIPSAALPVTAQITEIWETLTFYIPGSQMTAPTYRFAIYASYNGIEIASADTPADSAPFEDTRSPRILAVRIVPYSGGGISPDYTDADRQAFNSTIESSLQAFRRIYPMPGTEMVFWPAEVKMSDLLHDDGLVHLEQFNFSGAFVKMIQAMNVLADYQSSWNDMHPDQRAQFVVGFIEPSLYGGGASGFGVPPASMMADIAKFWAEQNLGILGDVLTGVLGIAEDALCFLSLGLFCEDPVDILVETVLGLLNALGYDITEKTSFVIGFGHAGAILAQEIGHNLGFVNPGMEEHDEHNISHSKYDEDVYVWSLLNAPGVSSPVLDVVPPGQVFGRWRLPKSVMAYAPSQTNNNTFLEPSFYRTIFNLFRGDYIPPGWDPFAARDRPGGGAEGPALRVSAAYSFKNGTLIVSEARPAFNGAGRTPPLETSPFTLAFLDAGKTVISEEGVPFSFGLPLHGHGDSGDDGDTEDVTAFFQVTRDIPGGTASAEIRFQGRTIWSVNALGEAPQVELLAPVGGESVAAGAELLIRWSSSDADGDALSHTVLWSLDGGATFEPIALALKGNELRWSTAVVAGSARAVVKVIASDGFHAGQAVSGELRIAGGKPSVMILLPLPEAKALASRPVSLRGAARAAGGAAVTDDAAFRWSSTPAGPLGSGREVLAGPLAAGLHVIKLEVEVSGVPASAELQLQVLADRDGDGIADQDETMAGLDPDDPFDPYLDSDQDGLTAGAELLTAGSDPANADTDGDGIPDGEEVVAGTSPIKKDTDADGHLDGADNCPTDSNADQSDHDGDAVGDACDPDGAQHAHSFRRGDTNADAEIDLTDGVSLLAHLFTGGPAPPCEDAADANDDGTMDISDALAVLGYLFLGSTAPPAPGPLACGEDPTPDSLEHCDLPPEACH